MSRLPAPGWRRRLAILSLLLATVIVAAGFWARARVRASLPRLDGEQLLAGLAAPVTISRDAQGVPTIVGANRQDVARATGYVHAQDRFFQMDLSRRRAAGELAALVGTRALPVDRKTRIHRFRNEAREALSLLSAPDRALLDAYTAGVNAGLDSLDGPPFEYLMLRQSPERWQPEDTFLVVLSMFLTLQESDGAYEATLGTMHEVLPAPMFEFLAPQGSEWDAAIDGSTFPPAPLPAAAVYDLRARRRGRPGRDLPPRAPESALLDDRDARDALGSNNWAVSGAHTRDGRALLANDMHLTIRVPNTWYRAVFEWPDASAPAPRHRLIGVTLPGVPAMVTGSNTHIAWGFTNTYADWSDIVDLEVDPADPNRYRTPGGWKAVTRIDEVIAVAGEPAHHETVTWTIWGPVIGFDRHGRPRAYRWVAHDASRLANALTPLEDARTVSEAFDAANGLGAPGQNLVVADRDGHIGWSIYGSIPRRTGGDGRLPSSWSDGRGWNGWLDRPEYPRIVDPPSGRIWTANARVVGGEMLARLGDGSYEIGSRATIIRNRLMSKEQVTARDLLRLQLDDSSEFLSRWRQLALQALTPAAVEGHPARAEFRSLLDRTWSPAIAPESVAYRLTRTFREQASMRVIRFALVECYEADPAFDYLTVRRREAPIWRLLTEQPPHLLDPRYDQWSDLLLDAVDAVIADAGATPLRSLTWASYNLTAYRHPLSAAIPFFGRWLDMPAKALPGDLFAPRVHWGAAGASERMIVSPGYEDEGIMEMPTGQSGHPLSPFYASSHQAWLDGAATPLLPGPAQHTFTLQPPPP